MIWYHYMENTDTCILVFHVLFVLSLNYVSLFNLKETMILLNTVPIRIRDRGKKWDLLIYRKVCASIWELFSRWFLCLEICFNHCTIILYERTYIYLYNKNQMKVTYRYFETWNVESNFSLFWTQLCKN